MWIVFFFWLGILTGLVLVTAILIVAVPTTFVAAAYGWKRGTVTGLVLVAVEAWAVWWLST